MTDVFASWNGPVGLMEGKATWGIEAWTFPSSELGTVLSEPYQANPVSFRQGKVLSKLGMIFHKDEIKETIGERSATLVGMGFHCGLGPINPLSSFRIKVSHTSLQTLADDFPETPEKNLINTQIKPTKNNWIFFGPFPLTGDGSFVWDGVSNLYFEISWLRTSGTTATGKASILASTPQGYHKVRAVEAIKNQILDDALIDWGAPRPATIFKWKL
jgi:hypothetical protein